MNYLFLDFETFYSSSFSVDSMPTDAYIVHPEFKIHGVAIKLNDGPTKWYAGKESVGPLKSVDWANTTLVCHNTYFDGFILNYWYKVVPKRYLCTMCMGRGLYGPDVSNSLSSLSERLGLGKKGEYLINTKGKRTLSHDEMRQLGEYSVLDVDLCSKSFNYMLPKYPEQELDLIDLTLRMFIEPKLVLNQSLLKSNHERVTKNKADMLKSLEWMIRPSLLPADPYEEIKDILMSDKKLTELLLSMGVEIPKKISKDGREISTFSKKDVGFHDLINSPDPRVKQVMEARLAVKSTIEETRSESMIDVGSRPYPVMLLYSKSVTHRWAGGGKRNDQNLPRGSDLRNAKEAPEGYVIGVADSSQIEARMVSYVASFISGTTCKLLDSFAKNKDVYSDFASVLYGYPVNKKEHPDERFVGKTAILGLGYQMSWSKFQVQLKLAGKNFDDEFCQRTVNLFRDEYKEIPALWWFMQDMLPVIASGGYKDLGFFKITPRGIEMPSGLTIIYNDLRSKKVEKWGKTVDEWSYYGLDNGKKSWINLYGGKVTENLIQGLARCVVAEQMLTISKRYPIVVFTHDEVGALIPEKGADEGLNWMIEAMSTPPSWCKDFPCKAEGGWAKNYSK